jgi:hypothetical protein
MHAAMRRFAVVIAAGLREVVPLRAGAAWVLAFAVMRGEGAVGEVVDGLAVGRRWGWFLIIRYEDRDRRGLTCRPGKGSKG